MRVLQLVLAFGALLVMVVFTGADRTARALPDAGSDRLPVVATIDVTSRLGSETIVLTGWAQVDREAPRDEGGVDVVDMEIVSIGLVGASSLGAISITQPTEVGPVGPAAQAADSGGDGDGFEVSPANAFRDITGTSAAASDLNSGTSTVAACDDPGKDRHIYNEFAVNLPPAAVVRGIEVRLDAWSDSVTGDPFMCVELSWDGGTTWTAPQSTATLSIGKAARLLGGATDTWGRSWSADELAPDNFRLRLTNVASDNQRDFFLDYVGVSVDFDSSSPGEIRSLQAGQDFPASSFFDLSVALSVPISAPGINQVMIHNSVPFRLAPREGVNEVDLQAWPPLGVTYGMEPIFGVDNDNDGSIDEDTPDEDLDGDGLPEPDGLFDEDQPGPDPVTPGSSLTPGCGNDADCDGTDGEDPSARYCVLNAITVCDDDGDGQIDEDPSCIPLWNHAERHEKGGFCVRNLTFEFAPELPSYSVARGGPSNLHPADILALTPGDVDPPPPPEPFSLVVCNDDFNAPQRWSKVSFLANAGETYHIQVGSWSSSVGGNLVLDVFSTPGSPTATSVSGNDNFANAWTISALPFLGQQSTSTATTQTGEPLNCSMGGHTVWYSFTASSSGTVTASTEATGNVPDTVLAVYTGGGFVTSPGPSGDQVPFVRIPCASLGLTANGCDSSGAVDDLDALSFGADELAGDISELNFSVGPGAQGLAGSAVRAQRDCPSPEPEPDEFHAAFNNTNDQVLDGNGPIGTCPGAFPLGLLEGATVRDDLDALYGEDPAAVDADTNGVPEQPVYFSLDAISPSLATFGFAAGDILKTVNGGQPTVYASAAALGLEAGDDLDALCLGESGNGAYGLDDALAFSLAPGSPTLAQIGAGPGDILLPGNPPTVDHNATSLGLQATDDVNALKCLALPPTKDPDGDTDGDGILNSDDPDDDNDGCTDEQELGSNPSQGGLRDPHSFWDFFDVPIGEPAVRDQRVTIGDIGAVVARFGTFREPPPTKEEAFAEALTPPPPAPAYHAAYDRGGSIPGANPWNLLPPDGAIIVGDIGAVVAQFGHSCAE